MRSFPDIKFIAGGGVTVDNAAEIVNLTGCWGVHGTGKVKKHNELHPDIFWFETDVSVMEGIVRSAKGT